MGPRAVWPGLDELIALVDGSGAWALHVRNAFAPIPKPKEAANLPRL